MILNLLFEFKIIIIKLKIDEVEKSKLDELELCCLRSVCGRVWKIKKETKLIIFLFCFLISGYSLRFDERRPIFDFIFIYSVNEYI